MTMHTGSVIEQLIAQVEAAEHNRRLRENSRCNNVIFDSGERAGQCNSSNVADPLNLPFCEECLKANPKLREDA
jgi:hypothetical protein